MTTTVTTPTTERLQAQWPPIRRAEQDARDLRTLMAYTGPLTEAGGFTSSTGSLLSMEQFTIGDGSDPALDMANLMESIKHGRGTRPGTYTALYVDNVLWMSDTDAEVRDHSGAVSAMKRSAGPVLIHGLGQGLVTAAALRLGRDVDVVDIEPGTWELLEGWLQGLAAETGASVTFHLGDALRYRWPNGKQWAVAWHDIWPSVTADNLDDMARLHRRFGRRTAWQSSWCHQDCLRHREHNRQQPWW